MRSSDLGVIPAIFQTTDVKGRAVLQPSKEVVEAVLAEIAQCVETGDSARLIAFMAVRGIPKRQAMKTPLRLYVSVSRCPNCWNGYMRMRSVSGKGDKTATAELAKVAAPPEFLRALVLGPKATGTLAAPAATAPRQEPPNPYAQA
jgi:hypothetical protein